MGWLCTAVSQAASDVAPLRIGHSGKKGFGVVLVGSAAQSVWSRVIQLSEGGWIDQSAPAGVFFSSTPETALLEMNRWRQGECLAVQSHIYTERTERRARRVLGGDTHPLSSQFKFLNSVRRLRVPLAEGALKNILFGKPLAFLILLSDQRKDVKRCTFCFQCGLLIIHLFYSVFDL